jgi:putative NADH-flavin reductase
MNLVVLGATGRTGRLVVDQALAAGHTVTAVVRSPEKLTMSHSNLRVVKGAATETSAVSSAMEGADAVISTLGGKGSVIADSTRAIVAAARMTGVSRAVVLSTFAAQRDRLNAGTRLLTGIGMGAMLKDKSAGEEMLRQSDLEWTVVYASILSDDPVNGSVVVLPEGAKRRMSERISRADVAAWMLQAATTGQHSRNGVGVTGSTRTVETSRTDPNPSGVEAATAAIRRIA